MMGHSPWHRVDLFGAATHEPTSTAAIIASVVSAIATAASGYVAYTGSQQQAAANRQNAENSRLNAEAAAVSAETNALNAERRAMQEREAADEEARQARLRGQRVMGEQRATFGAMGVEIAEGSPLEVLGFQAGQSELEVQNILRAGRNSAADALQEAGNFRYQADVTRLSGGATANLYMQRAAQAGAGGYVGAASNILTGATRWAQDNQGTLRSWFGGSTPTPARSTP